MLKHAKCTVDERKKLIDGYVYVEAGRSHESGGRGGGRHCEPKDR